VTGIFKANNPYNNFLLFVYGFILKLPMFINRPLPQEQPLDGTLYKSFLNILAPIGKGFPLIYSIISFILLIIQALIFNRVVNDQRMHQKTNYLTGMSYLLITSLFIEWYSLSSPLIVSTILIWVWSKLCQLHNNPAAKTAIFNIGFAIGLCTFFYTPAVAFLILVMVGLIIARPFKLPEWIMGLVGILTPFYFFGAWLFLTDKWQTYKLPEVKITIPTFHESEWSYAAMIMVLVTVALGTFFTQSNLRRQVVQTRKNWRLLFLYLMVSALVPFLNATQSFNYWILMAVPLSAIAASAFLYPDRKWFPLTIHWGMVIISIVIGYFLR